MHYQFNIKGLEEAEYQMFLVRTQQRANHLIDHFDYRDIKEGVKVAQNSVAKADGKLTSLDTMITINKLFDVLEPWLGRNGRRV